MILETEEGVTNGAIQHNICIIVVLPQDVHIEKLP